MSDPLAYHITWTTYGTWLPGDSRGWVKSKAPGIQAPNARVEEGARGKLDQTPVMLTEEERQIVEQTIRRHCEI